MARTRTPLGRHVLGILSLVGIAALTLMLVGTSYSFGNTVSTAPGAPSLPKTTWCETHLSLPTPICHVFVVFLENKNVTKVETMPFQGHYLTAQYAFAAQFYSVIHFSFPNYLAATGAFATNYQHVTDRANVVNLIQNHTPALKWEAYMQGMPSPCYNQTAPQYRTAHNPFIWYADIWDNQTYCKEHDRTFGPWYDAVLHNNVPNYGFFAPNVTNDCWKYGAMSCDKWLQSWLTPLVNDSFFKSSAFLITYDESTKNDTSSSNGTIGGGHVYTAVVSPYSCKGYVSQIHYNTYSIMTTTEWLLGLGRVNAQDNWTNNPPMKDLFCFNSTNASGLHASGPFLGGASALSGTLSPIAVARPAPRAIGVR